MKTSIFRQLTGRGLNLLLWIGFCSMTGTGLLLAFRLPPGSKGGRGLSALGLDRHVWGEVHTWIGYAFILLILAHLAVHWRWVWQFAARRRAWPVLAGVGAGIALALCLVLLPVQKRQGDAPGSSDSPRLQMRGGGWSR